MCPKFPKTTLKTGILVSVVNYEFFGVTIIGIYFPFQFVYSFKAAVQIMGSFDTKT